MSEPNYIQKLVAWAKDQEYPLTLLAEFAGVNYYTLHHHVGAPKDARGPNKLTNLHAKKLYLALKDVADLNKLPRSARIARINTILEAVSAT